MLTSAYLCDAIRTPFCRHGGALASIRVDDLAAVPLTALMVRNPDVDWEQLSDISYGCANQAGEDGRNVARMASLLAGLPASVSANTINRLCGSGMDAVGSAARAIKAGEASLMIAGGVESMSRAPYVLTKAEVAFSREQQLTDTTQGWRLANRLLKHQYGLDSLAQAAENLAAESGIGRQAQDHLAWSSHRKARAARQAGLFDVEITPVTLAHLQDEPAIVIADDEPQDWSLEALTALPGIVHAGGTITAGNAAGLHDGACALLLASEKAAHKHNLMPKARVLGMAASGVPPHIAGIAPASAVRKLLVQTGLAMDQMDVIELHEGCAASVIAVLRDWGLKDDDARVNPQGGAIAIGHPLGASGTRQVMSAMHQLHRIKGRYALCAMAIDVGQGLAMVIERV